MAHTIINTPSVYSAKLPTKGWINLAQIRQLEFDETASIVCVVWQNGDKQIFYKADAQALIDAWNEAVENIANRTSNYRQLNRRLS
ncbi:hypothetical protein RIVM261_013040 [Rivularia sp. IAM M-261]|nr:hypothetical protein RIVM261_013040 [Rivularia sp. IAM M-261]